MRTQPKQTQQIVTDVCAPFDSNLAERDVSIMKFKQKSQELFVLVVGLTFSAISASIFQPSVTMGGLFTPFLTHYIVVLSVPA